MTVDTGLLIVRLLIGALFVGHGAQKLFGWFGGHGLEGTAGWLESMGIRPGRFAATMAGLAEAVGGLLFAFGFLGPLGGLLIAAVMIVAIVKVHGQNGLWVTDNGFEYPLVTLVTALVVAAVGPGAYSLDHVLRIAFPEPMTFWVGTVVMLVAVAGMLMAAGQPAGRRASTAH
jgi:putative oxidoreductase